MRPAGLALALAALLALTGCTGTTPDDTSPSGEVPRALTTAEAERLAVVRFNNFSESPRAVSVRIEHGGDLVSLEGVVDYTTHVVFARVASRQGETTGDFFTFSTLAEVGVLDVTAGTPAGLPDTVPAGDWDFVALDPGSSDLATALLMVVNLGSDRPENPQLLQQSNARLLQQTTLHQQAVSVFSGPDAADGDTSGAASAGALRYYVNDVGHVLRVVAVLGTDGATIATIDFGQTAAVTLTDPRPSGG